MSDVPMTRPEEMLAIHETTFFHSSTFVELEDGRILHAAGTAFTTSDDGGLTWSEPFSCTDTDGNPVGGGGTCLVKLSGEGIGLAAMCRDPLTHLVFWRSEDGGTTWEPPVPVTPPGIPTHAYQDVMLVGLDLLVGLTHRHGPCARWSQRWPAWSWGAAGGFVRRESSSCSAGP